MEEPRRHPARTALTYAVRIAVGAGVLGFVVLRHPHELIQTIKQADVGWVLGASAMLFAGIFLSAFRWHEYLIALELPLSLGTLFRLYFVGTFFNSFLPTGVGGDAYKAVRLGKARGGMVAEAFASAFLDRFAGLVGLALLGFVAVGIELIAHHPDKRVATVSVVLSAGILAVASILLIWGERLLGKGKWIKDHGWGEGIRRLVRGIHLAGRHPGAAARGYLLGVVFQAMVVGYHLMLARALNIHGVSIAEMTGVCVIAAVATMIPLTVGGIGFRESSYVWALGTFGIVSHEARAFAVLILAITLATSLAGAIVYLVGGGEVAPEERTGPRPTDR